MKANRFNFRVFIGKSMIKLSDYDLNTFQGIKQFADITNGKYEKVHLMQSTGLTDKNGVEIYEGDIVSGRNEYELSDIINKDGVWIMSQFCGHKPALWEIVPCEVVGNIWQNGDLLKGVGGNE